MLDFTQTVFNKNVHIAKNKKIDACEINLNRTLTRILCLFVYSVFFKLLILYTPAYDKIIFIV